jgi:hypothetical protein
LPLLLALAFFFFYFSKGIHQVQLEQQQSQNGKANEVSNELIEIEFVHCNPPRLVKRRGDS